MFSPHWRSPTTLSIAGVCAVSSTALLQKPLMYPPAVYQTGVVVSYFLASLPSSMPWWRLRRAPSTGGSYHHGASSQRSRRNPRPVVRDVLVLFFTARSIEPMMFPALREVPWGSRPGYLQTPGFLLWYTALVLVWPVVPYILALSSKRSLPVVSPAVRSTVELFRRPVGS